MYLYAYIRADLIVTLNRRVWKFIIFNLFVLAAMLVFYAIFKIEIIEYYKVLESLSQYEIENGSSRAHLSGYYFNLLTDNFFFGTGSDIRLDVPGSTETYKFGEFQAHNNFLEILTICGLPLGSLILYILYYPFYKLFKKLSESHVVLLFFMNLSIFLFSFTFTIYSWKTLWIMVALTWIILKDERRNYFESKIK
jgi:hypothetical protein